MKPANLDSISANSLDPKTYGSLRCALIRYFEWNNVDDPEDLADEVFCRLLQNIGGQTDIKSLQAFAYGIAQNLLKEHWRKRGRERNLSESDPDQAASLTETLGQDVSEALAQDLDECLKSLSKQERWLIQAFHAAEGAKKVEKRKKLADQLGISQNALRIRVSRIRKKLADCIEEKKRLRNQEPRSGRSPRKS